MVTRPTVAAVAVAFAYVWSITPNSHAQLNFVNAVDPVKDKIITVHSHLYYLTHVVFHLSLLKVTRTEVKITDWLV